MLFMYTRRKPLDLLVCVHNGVVAVEYLFRMTHGTTIEYGTHFRRRYYSFHVQKKPHHWNCGTWWSYPAYGYYERRGCEQDAIYAHVSFSNCMERSVFARGTSRREHTLRKLEENYSQKNRENFAEFTKSVKRKYKDERCESPRFIFGNKSVTVDGYAAKKSAPAAKRFRNDDGRPFDGPCRDRVLQALGSDLIAPFLTPLDMYSVKCAFKNDWKWERVWNGHKVRLPSAAVRVRLCIELGYDIEDIQPRWGTRNLMDGVWGYLSVSECQRLADKYKDIKTLRKLM